MDSRALKDIPEPKLLDQVLPIYILNDTYMDLLGILGSLGSVKLCNSSMA